MNVTEPHIETPLDELTHEELDAIGTEITEQIRFASELHDDALVDQLLAQKDRINKLKADAR